MDRGPLGCPRSSVSLTHWDSRDREHRVCAEAAGGEVRCSRKRKRHCVVSHPAWRKLDRQATQGALPSAQTRLLTMIGTSGMRT